MKKNSVFEKRLCLYWNNLVYCITLCWLPIYGYVLFIATILYYVIIPFNNACNYLLILIFEK